MSGPTSYEVDYASEFLHSLFPRIDPHDLRGPEPTPEELAKYPEILPPSGGMRVRPVPDKMTPETSQKIDEAMSGNSDQAEVLIKENLQKQGIAGVYTRRNNIGQSRKTLRASRPGGDIVMHLLVMRNQIKLYHWQTSSFADHKATDDLTSVLDQKIDMFVEVFMGKYGRPQVSGSMKLHNFTGESARSFVERQTLYLLTVLPHKLKKTDTDLLNIRDEILAELNKIRYLFTLN